MSEFSPLAGGVFHARGPVDSDGELRQLVDDIGRRSFDKRVGDRSLPERLDDGLWHDLEATGLARLTSTPDLGAGPAELATVLRGLAHHAGAVPLAETDLLAAWLAQKAGLQLPEAGPLTVAIADAVSTDDRVSGTAIDVPWTQASAAVLLAACATDGVYVGILDDARVDEGHNLAGEPRDRVTFDVPIDRLHHLDGSIASELMCRGAWARCCQLVGALDAAAELTVSHTRERVQFGRPLSAFQAVQHALTAMAGDIERARATATHAVAAAADYGFSAPQAQYTITVAKVVLGQVVGPVTTIAHQLHGAIGVTAEHPLWLTTLRAQSWIDEFGSTTHYAKELGRIALDTADVYDVLIGKL
ncbi:MAG: acyl-CoA dehydrogenase [Mycobacterium sp.]|jgi:acyl-CoA dehydrogenase|nr:putative acyl-CoA dehydrogenase [Mycobacterium sp.]MDT5131013.1 acyl-CoA dehydrogenase [Mycobacterium sp.]